MHTVSRKGKHRLISLLSHSGRILWETSLLSPLLAPTLLSRTSCIQDIEDELFLKLHTSSLALVISRVAMFILLCLHFGRLLLIAFLLHRCQIGMRLDPQSFARVWLARLDEDYVQTFTTPSALAHVISFRFRFLGVYVMQCTSLSGADTGFEGGTPKERSENWKINDIHGPLN